MTTIAQPNDTGERVEVTPGDAMLFVDEAFRNLDVPELGLDDVEDVQRALQSAVNRLLARHRLRSTLTTDAPAVERAGVEGEVVGKQAAIQVALTTAPGLDAAYSRQAAWGYDQARQQIAANLAALSPVAQERPEAGGDYALVPCEPTEAMIRAGDDAGAGPQDLGDGLTRAIWAAMLAAAPALHSPVGQHPATERADGKVADLTRPIVGIENRTAQKALEIMCDRIRRALGAPTHEG